MQNKRFLISFNLYFILITVHSLHLQSNTLTKWIDHSCNIYCQKLNGDTCGWIIKSCCKNNDCNSSIGQKCEGSKPLSVNCNQKSAIYEKLVNIRNNQQKNIQLNRNKQEQIMKTIEQIENEFKNASIKNQNKSIDINNLAQNILKLTNNSQNPRKQKILQQITDIANNELKNLLFKIAEKRPKEELINLNKKISMKITELIDSLQHNVQSNHTNSTFNININITQKQKTINDTISKIILNKSLQKTEMKSMMQDLFKIQLENQKLKKIFNETTNNNINSSYKNLNNSNQSINNSSINHKQHNQTNVTQQIMNIDKVLNTNNKTNNQINITIPEISVNTKNISQQNNTFINNNNTKQIVGANNTQKNNIIEVSKNPDKTTITINKVITINTIITINKTDKINQVKKIDANDLINGNVEENDVKDILAIIKKDKNDNVQKKETK